MWKAGCKWATLWLNGIMGDKGTGVEGAQGGTAGGYDPSIASYAPPDGAQGNTWATPGYPYAPYAPNAAMGGAVPPSGQAGGYGATPSYYPYAATETKGVDTDPVKQAYNHPAPPEVYAYPNTTAGGGKDTGFVNVDLGYEDQAYGGGNGAYGNHSDHDIEEGADTNITEAGTRNQFLKKVYAIVTIQILITAGISMLCIFVEPLVTFFSGNGWIWIIFLVCGFITLFILQMKRQNYPSNMVLLGIFTLFMGWFVGSICAAYQARGYGSSVAFAFVITLAIFICITAYCWISKKDFSFLIGFIAAGFIALAVAFIVVFTIDVFGDLNQWAWFAIAIGGSLLMTAVLLFDTSQIVNKYPVDEYIQGAISLYLDFINLFLCLLSAFGST